MNQVDLLASAMERIANLEHELEIAKEEIKDYMRAQSHSCRCGHRKIKLGITDAPELKPTFLEKRV